MFLSAEARLQDEAVRIFQAAEAGPIGLAVSGGSDSMAMLWLIAPWAMAQRRPVSVATVDHGLRKESAEEAAFVARICARMGLPHDVLHWQGWDGRGNLQARARKARYGLLSAWARAGGITTLALGHTMDDQAETVLLRLARGSGVDGLSGMEPARVQEGLRWVRPLLGLRREALRDFLRQGGRDWCEDPSNANDRFERIKARRALAALSPLGVDTEGLVRTAARMAIARKALEDLARETAAALVTIVAGDVVFARPELDQVPEETRLRLLSEAIRWVGRADYRPRLAALQDALAGLATERQRTLQGTLLSQSASSLRVGREFAAVMHHKAPVGGLWDGRWRVEGPEEGTSAPPLEVRALGEAGLRTCSGWRAAGLPRTTLLASPAVWRGENLVAAPLARPGQGWTARIAADFRLSGD